MMRTRVLAVAWIGFLALSACGEPEAKPPATDDAVAIVSFAADRNMVAPGSDVTLTWSTRNAKSIAIDAGGQPIDLGGAAAAGGQISVRVEATTTFELTAVGARPGDVASRQVEVRVDELAPAILSLSATPSQLGGPGDVEIAWTTERADAIQLLSPAGAIDLSGKVPGADSVVVRIDESTTFRLIATRAGTDARAQQELSVEVIGAPTIERFEAAAAVVGRSSEGTATARLVWSGVVGADELSLDLGGREVLPIPEESLAAGSIDVEIDEDTVFILRARNAFHEAVRSATVRVVDAPRIVSFTGPAFAGPGVPFSLSWQTIGATSIALKQDGVGLSVDETQTTGSMSLFLSMDASFELSAFNEAGDEVTAVVAVPVVSPDVVAFTASPMHAWLGAGIDFEWTTVGGTSIELTDADGARVCQTAELADVAAGGCTIPASFEGPRSFTLTVRNVVLSARLTIEVRSSRGPRIDVFEVTPAKLRAGEAVTVSWEVGGDPDGMEPELLLVDNRGGTHPLPAGSASGTASLTLGEIGRYDFTLTASTTSPGSDAATATASVTTHGPPQVTLAFDPVHFDRSLGETATLSWTSQNADASLEIFLLGPGGVLPASPFLQVPLMDRPSGSYDFEPTSDGTYRIVATNGLGETATQDVSITVAPTQILSFTATPPEVVAGDPVTLSWTTQGTAWTGLDLLSPFTRQPAGDSFIDNKGNGTRIGVLTGCNNTVDDGCEVITFPAGFTFPFGGAVLTQAQVFANGIVGFRIHQGNESGQNRNLPNTQYSWVNLAPFWDDLRRGMTSEIWTGLASDARGDYFAIQWHHMEFRSGGGDLTFEVALRPDGSFEFRYGMMTGVDQARADGNSATIGYQLTDGLTGELVHFGADHGPVAGGLSNTGWSFVKPASLGANGNFTWTPAASPTGVTISRQAILQATGVGSDTESVSVTVHPRATVSAQVQQPDVVVGDVFTIAWTTSKATSLQVLDEAGAVICSPGASQVAAGACNLSEDVVGTYTYRVRAYGALGHFTEQVLTVPVSPPLVIQSFTPSATVIDRGGSVTLTWVTSGATTVAVEADGNPLPTTGANVDGDSVVHAPLGTTTYVVRIGAGTRTKEATVEVTVRTLDLQVAVDANDVHPGTTVNSTWSTQTFGPGTPIVQAVVPMTEVSSTSTYHDISNTGTLLLAPSFQPEAWTTIDLAALGFSFPYFGKSYGKLRISSQGTIGFDPSLSGWEFKNEPLPTSTPALSRLALFPYWGDLKRQDNANTYPTTGIYGELIQAGPGGVDAYVVQFHHHRLMPEQSDLNFQVVLFADGSFEYRYGAMNPGTSDLTKGARTTIGYQVPGANQGSTLHYGGPYTAGTAVPFAGGLAHRAFRFDTQPQSGGFSFQPASDTDVFVCASLDGYSECKTVTVTAEFAIRSFTVDQTQIDEGQSVVLSWDTRGADAWKLTANGVLLGDEDTLPQAGTLPIMPDATTDYVLEIHSLGRTITRTVRVNVRLFDLTLTASTPLVHPGSPVTLSWTVTPPTATPAILAPMTETSAAPFVDISALADKATLIGANAENVVVDHAFPAGFSFPFLGVPHSSVRISENGFLSFAPTTGAQFSNQRLPIADANNVKVHLAPFWDQLYSRTNGRVYAAAIDADTYVIQWTRFSTLGSSATNEYNLNFQVVLHRDGSFEYRYGTMSPPPNTNSLCRPNTCVNEARGSSATIGYQDPTGTAGFLLHFGGTTGNVNNPTFLGGLANRTFRYTAVQGSGSLTVKPTDTTDYTVCAIRGLGLVCRTARVEAPWKIVSFTADKAQVPPNTPVSLSWETIGADSIVLRANGNVVPTTGVDPNEDSFTVVPTENTTYTLELISLGRSVTATTSVKFQTLELEVEASADSALPGDAITFDWTTTPLTGGTPVMTLPLIEWDQPFEDISGTGTVLPAFNNTNFAQENINFPSTFRFPFYGQDYSSVRVLASGVLSFNLAEFNSQFNNSIPNTTFKGKNLAVFWAYLNSRGPGRVHWKHGTGAAGEYVIIQWSHYSFENGSTTTPHDLNFQVVLHEDGRIEYRYGVMSAPGRQAAADGAEATIGYQDPTGTMGNQLTYNAAISGGLSNRSFVKYPDIGSGSATVTVNSSMDFRVCAQIGAFLDCKTVSVFVPGPGDVVLSELMLDPSPSSAGQWFEVRNVQTRPIDIGGWEFASDGGSFVVSGPLVLAPGGHATFASNPSPGFTPTAVYGPGLPLAPAGDALELRVRTKRIAQVTWNPTWTIPQGASLELEPTRQRPGNANFTSQGDFCSGTLPYDGTNVGTPGAKAGCSIHAYLMDFHSNRQAIDISAVATPLTGVAGLKQINHTIGFSFPFFGNSYSQLVVSPRGSLSITSSLLANFATNATLPSTSLPASGGMIAPFWFDLKEVPGRSVVWSADVTVGGARVQVFQWDGWLPVNGTKEVSFQAQLWENGEIVFAYLDLGTDTLSRGGGATVGIQEVSASAPRALEYSFRQPRLTTGQSILFTPR